MSFWDKSVDKRGKSNCAFLFRGHYTFNEVCEMARERFPSIMNRFEFEIFEYVPTVDNNDTT